ncbi:Molybdenum cofactor biosynthesis enzyme and related Fe-S oxidoreductases [hydrothermal vent metagenome]|uniref:Molybdenum cofactor biosynthesis enzyme and related Fe-S oxidoreductases n=1 Tax=hydrothermal vent metagenome TaxID=652676 RepID=A0A1W1BVI6_9ZZZZ
MKYYRIYIELTNICGLKCSFCPTKNLPNTTMDLDFFESIVKQAKSFTNEIACHLFGDPLTLSNLKEYLDIIDKYKMKALLTTSGYFMKKHNYDTLFHPAVKQINISLNAFNKNDTRVSFEQYIRPILELCHKKVERREEIFINLRLWNLDELMSEKAFNSKLFDILTSSFEVDLSLPKKREFIRLDYKVRLHFDNYFEWPSLNNPNYGHGTCQGLSSHIGILASGEVVPCCLDGEGIMSLGSLQKHSLSEIILGDRAKAIVDGFKEGKCSEELCLRCSYKDRFR